MLIRKFKRSPLLKMELLLLYTYRCAFAVRNYFKPTIVRKIANAYLCRLIFVLTDRV